MSDPVPVLGELIDLPNSGAGGGGETLGIEVMSDDQDVLQLVMVKYRPVRGGGYQPIPGALLVVALEDAEHLILTLGRVTQRAEQAKAADKLRIDSEK